MPFWVLIEDGKYSGTPSSILLLSIDLMSKGISLHIVCKKNVIELFVVYNLIKLRS